MPDTAEFRPSSSEPHHFPPSQRGHATVGPSSAPNALLLTVRGDMTAARPHRLALTTRQARELAGLLVQAADREDAWVADQNAKVRARRRDEVSLSTITGRPGSRSRRAFPACDTGPAKQSSVRAAESASELNPHIRTRQGPAAL